MPHIDFQPEQLVMLTLNNVTIHLQNFGTRYAIYLVSQNQKSIEQRYYSFWNHEATKGELEWWSDNVGVFWIAGDKHGTADNKLRLSLARIALATLLNKGHNKGDVWPDACDVAYGWYDSINHVTWLSFDVDIDFGTGYALGSSVTAEKGTGNFNDDVLASSLTRSGLVTPKMEWTTEPEDANVSS